MIGDKFRVGSYEAELLWEGEVSVYHPWDKYHHARYFPVVVRLIETNRVYEKGEKPSEYFPDLPRRYIEFRDVDSLGAKTWLPFEHLSPAAKEGMPSALAYVLAKVSK